MNATDITAVPLLELRSVDIAAVDETTGTETVICRAINLTIDDGERHILLGPNGSGKSTLLAGIMGLHPFRITAGAASLRGVDITDMEIEERGQAGIGLAFQRPPALAGVSVAKLAHAIGASDRLGAAEDALGLGHLGERDVNVGFSGGEAKRFEVMKLALQAPRSASSASRSPAWTWSRSAWSDKLSAICSPPPPTTAAPEPAWSSPTPASSWSTSTPPPPTSWSTAASLTPATPTTCSPASAPADTARHPHHYRAERTRSQ